MGRSTSTGQTAAYSVGAVAPSGGLFEKPGRGNPRPRSDREPARREGEGDVRFVSLHDSERRFEHSENITDRGPHFSQVLDGWVGGLRNGR